MIKRTWGLSAAKDSILKEREDAFLEKPDLYCSVNEVPLDFSCCRAIEGMLAGSELIEAVKRCSTDVVANAGSLGT